ncbi:hypothetical protein A6E01_20275 (plasmid) [Vibrio breoganii]|uniref:Uncharacterized protein n=1 Tax=Vibrio breoganii TaxID=553239 RepID=A0AAN0XZS5_9VIBR|nr:hypothetical protein [Vibrio breoganii]ANO35551.1 hypothetical protein A6E01_20275 [Vibrio breoganii]PML15814.1 hypothetical protein BCT84_07370 [Vibrio breoganii]
MKVNIQRLNDTLVVVLGYAFLLLALLHAGVAIHLGGLDGVGMANQHSAYAKQMVVCALLVAMVGVYRECRQARLNQTQKCLRID